MNRSRILSRLTVALLIWMSIDLALTSNPGIGLSAGQGTTGSPTPTTGQGHPPSPTATPLPTRGGTPTVPTSPPGATTPVLPVLSIGNITVSGSSAGETDAVFPVSLAPVASWPVAVDYQTRDGTAVAGKDYEPAQGTLSFASGETTKTIVIKVKGGTSPGQDTNFYVVLVNPLNAKLGTSTGTATIHQDAQPTNSPTDTPTTSPTTEPTQTESLHPEILFPAQGSTLCTGSTVLLGRNVGAGQPGESATWAYSRDGGSFETIPSQPSTGDSEAPSTYGTSWDTSRLASGPAMVRLTLQQATVSAPATTQVTLDRPPALGNIRAGPGRARGSVTLSVPHAVDSDGRITSMRWYLGDGTVATGRHVHHHYRPGHYVVAVEARDDHNCVTQLVRQVDMPLTVSTRLADVDYCDPLSVTVNHAQNSYKDRKKKVEWDPSKLGPVGHVGPITPDTPSDHPKKDPNEYKQMVAAYGFELVFVVEGEPKLCHMRQFARFVRTLHLGDPLNADAEQVLPKDGGAEDFFQDDPEASYQGTPERNGDGTATVRYIDLPGFKVKGEGLKVGESKVESAQENGEVFAVIDGTRDPTEREAVSELHAKEKEGPGETLWVKFSFCTAWNPPKGTRSDNFSKLAEGGPDDDSKSWAPKTKAGEDGDWKAGGPGVTGCGEAKK